ncbi:MAG: hypothetical protein TREMPRED_004929 [Tremellales sp. Tagirdzhanova-0007]|nr:MAG: hypothetical protein TREMPRED_004929 [Tremellales sp. Tagirdzhanova-0007]
MAEVLASDHILNRRESLTQTFEAYRAELDADNDRRERLIILSRTITQLSKKLIFHLHRGATASNNGARKKNLAEARGKEREIWDNFVKVREVLQNGEPQIFWRWNRQISPGLEEYIEALSFLHYLEKQSLITLTEIQSTLSDSETGKQLITVTPEDYVLGMSDLTGELMRYATNGKPARDHSRQMLTVTVAQHFDGIPSSMLHKLTKKQEETTRSMEKIEKLCYALRLRLLEYADRPDVLRQMAKRALGDARDQEGEPGKED